MYGLNDDPGGCAVVTVLISILVVVLPRSIVVIGAGGDVDRHDPEVGGRLVPG